MLVHQPRIISEGKIKKTIFPSESKPNLYFAERAF